MWIISTVNFSPCFAGMSWRVIRAWFAGLSWQGVTRSDDFVLHAIDQSGSLTLAEKGCLEGPVTFKEKEYIP